MATRVRIPVSTHVLHASESTSVCRKIYLLTMEPRNWDEVQVEADRIVAESPEPFDPSTVVNARELISVCRAQCPLPMEVAKGYWSTISLSWPKFEIEVFEDRLEIYHFKDDKNTDISYEKHKLGDAFSERFMSELPKLSE